MRPIVPTTVSSTQSSGPPTYRWNQTPDSGSSPGPVGIDTLRLHGPISSHSLTRRTERSRIDRETGEVVSLGSRSYETIQVLGQEVSLQADDHRATVTFEVSIPKVLRGSNEVAAQPWEVHEAVEFIYDSASSLVTWDCPWERLEVNRLDLVRPFENVHDIDSTLHRLSRLPRQAGRVRKTFNDPASGGATTFTAGTPKRWMVTAYDKPTEMFWAARKQADLRLSHHLRETANDLRSRGHLRTEMSIRRHPLKEREAATNIIDLTQETTMTRIAEHYFRQAGMDTAVGGTEKVQAALQAMSDDPTHRRLSNQVLGMLWREANGLPQTSSTTSLDKYRQVARAYGLTAADFVTPDNPEVRLDWASGLLVEDAAA